MYKIYDICSKFMGYIMFSRNSFKRHSESGVPWDSGTVTPNFLKNKKHELTPYKNMISHRVSIP